MKNESLKKEKYQVIRLLIVLIVTIFAVEFSIMVFFYFIGGIHMESLTIGFIDSLLLVLIVSPVIYLVSYRPLLLQIRERKHVEENLRKEKDFSDTTIDSLPGTFYLFDDQGRFLRWNKNLESVSGYCAEEISKMHPQDLFMGEDRRIIGERIQEVFAKGQSTAEADLVSKDGHKTPFFLTGMRIIIDQKQCLVGLGIDITERKQAEKELRETRDYLENLLNYANAPIIVWDPGFRIIRFNHAFERLTGRMSDEVLGKKLDILFPEDKREESLAHIHRTVAGERWETVEIPILCFDGTLRIVLWNSATLYAPDGTTAIATIAQGQDITERKQAEKNLKQTVTELEQFAYVASHHLQEPLRMMVSFSQLLEKRYKNKLDKDADEFINYIVDGAIRMQRLINDLLMYSQVDRHSEPFKSVNCETMLELAMANLNIAIEQNGAVITHDPLPVVKTDTSQMVRLFQNLLDNAIKFRREAPRIHVSALLQGNEYVFSVRDNGIGIAPEFLKKIFMIFQQIHRREEYPGTGIGLAICKKIVERQGGRIWVESEAAKGSTFYFTIPKR